MTHYRRRSSSVALLAAAARRAAGGAALGALLAVFLLAVGLVRVAIARLSGRRVAMDGFEFGAALYALGFAAAGAVVGALWPLRRSLLGRYALGVIGATVVAAFIARAADGPVSGWGGAQYVTIGIMGVIFGAVAGYQIGK